MTPDPGTIFDLLEALQLLERTPAAFQALLGDLPPEWVGYQEDAEAWSPTTVVVHMVHNERENWIPRLRVLLSEQEDRRFPPFGQLPETETSHAQTLPENLAAFARLRRTNVDEVRGLGLTSGDLGRTAEHPVLGTVTLEQLLATWVVHDMNHLFQVAKTLAKRYAEAVGPWRQNLPLLDL